MTFPEPLKPHPRLWLSQPRIDELKGLIAARRDPFFTIWQGTEQQAEEALGLTPQPYTGRLPEAFNEAMARDGDAARVLAYAYVLTGEERYARKAVEILLAWSHAEPVPASDFDPAVDYPNVGLRILHVHTMVETYDLLHDHPAWTQHGRDALETWFRLFMRLERESIHKWDTPHEQTADGQWVPSADADPLKTYFGHQLYNNHLSAHNLCLLAVSLVLGDRDNMQFALDHEDNPRDILEMIAGAILMPGDETYTFDHHPQHRNRVQPYYDRFMATRVEPFRAHQDPVPGEIYDRYRPNKRLVYTYLHLYFLVRAAELAFQNGVDLYRYTAPGGENLELSLDFFADFMISRDVSIRGAFYDYEASRHRMEYMPEKRWTDLYEIATVRYPENPTFPQVLRTVDRTKPHGGLICLRHGPDIENAAGEATPSGAFERRRDESFEALRGQSIGVDGRLSAATAGQIPGRALVAFWLNDQVDEANRALADYARFFIDNRAARNDQHSLYWTAELTTRCVSLFGRDGTVAGGRLETAVEDLLLEMMWRYVDETSRVDSMEELSLFYAATEPTARHAAGDPMPVSANVEDTQTWDVIESENHHAMSWMTCWDFTRLLSMSPRYSERCLEDGQTVSKHYAAWTAYAKAYIRERARKGLFVEMADDTYNSFTVKGLYNIADVAEDSDLRRLAANLITLYYASWAQEQLDGVRGGGKSRMNSTKDRRSATTAIRMMWYYAGIGGPSTPANQRLAALTSTYRLPALVADLATDPHGRGVYEISDRPLGLAVGGHWTNPHYRLNTDGGGIIRYAFCTPDFIMGLPMVPPRKCTQWTKISSQGRWQGVIFAGDRDARIFVQCGRPAGSNNNQQMGVQRRGTMITQRLQEGYYAKGTVNTRVWVSDNGLSNVSEEGGWVFVEAAGAYAAVRPARGGYSWVPCEEEPADGSDWSGRWMLFDDEYAPAIIDVGRKADYRDYDAFRRAARACAMTWEGTTLHYEGLSGDSFVFRTDWKGPPLVNGETMSYGEPDYAFRSPFLTSAWNSGIVEISFGGRKLALDFTVSAERGAAVTD